jgi:hypothetical protein
MAIAPGSAAGFDPGAKEALLNGAPLPIAAPALPPPVAELDPIALITMIETRARYFFRAIFLTMEREGSEFLRRVLRGTTHYFRARALTFP